MAATKEITLSVIIPCYNQGAFLLEAIESVERYQGDDYEIIIVNDGSGDPQTLAILESLSLSYQVLNKPNGGVAAARNYGLERSKGKYFLPLDADNKIYPGYIEHGVKELERDPAAGMVYGGYKIFGDQEGESLNKPLDMLQMIYENHIDTCAIVRKDAWLSVGGYDQKAPINTWQDWIFWMDLIIAGWKFKYIDEILFEYRIRKDSALRTFSNDYKKKLIMYDYVYDRQQTMIKALKNSLKIDKSTRAVRYIEDKNNIRLAYYKTLDGKIFSAWHLIFIVHTFDNLILKFRIFLFTPFKYLYIRFFN